EVLNEIGCAQLELGLLEESDAYLRWVTVAKAATGLVGTRSFVDANRAFVFVAQGRLVEARIIIDRALADAGEIGTRARGGCETCSAYIAYRAGDFPRAKRAAQAAIDSSRDWPSLQLQATALMGRTLLALGRPKQATAFARKANEMLDAGAQIEDGEALV